MSRSQFAKLLDKVGTSSSPVSEINTEQISNVTGTNPFLSSEDDLSDVSIYRNYVSPASLTDYVLLDVTDGPKTVLGIYAVGDAVRTTGNLSHRIGPVTIDGNVNSQWPATGFKSEGGDEAGNKTDIICSPQFRYDSSLKVEWRHSGSGHLVTVYAIILGSGPHSVAVVKDGKPVHMTAENLNEETIEGMGIPSGYKIVRDPDITHEDPQNSGMWDDSKGEVVDHPYWKPFYNALEKARIVSKQYGFREFLKNVGTPSDRGKIPLETPDPSIGTYPPNESSDTPVEDAVKFIKKQKDKELPEKIG